MALRLWFDYFSQPSRACYIFCQMADVPVEMAPIRLNKQEHRTDEFKRMSGGFTQAREDGVRVACDVAFRQLMGDTCSLSPLAGACPPRGGLEHDRELLHSSVSGRRTLISRVPRREGTWDQNGRPTQQSSARPLWLPRAGAALTAPPPHRRAHALFPPHLHRYLATTQRSRSGAPVADHWFPKDPRRRARVDSALDWSHWGLRRWAARLFW